MKKRALIGLLATTGLLVAAGWVWGPVAGETGTAGNPAVGPVASAPAAPAKAAGHWPFHLAAADAAPTPRPAQDSPLLPMSAYAPAAVSMAEAREQGDPRTPPIERAPAAALPDAWALASPDHYAQFEAQQSARLYAAYQQAAEVEIPKLQAAINAARASGLSAEQLAVGEEKLWRLQAARDQAAALLGQQHSPR
jgi:hypothetical protein